MSELDSSVGEYIYCLNCFYNLHGLIEHRCPECGRLFNPADSRTYSRTPSAQRFPKFVQRVALAINETVRQATAHDSEGSRHLSLLRRVGCLERQNTALRVRFDFLVELLRQKNALSSKDLETLTELTPGTEDEAHELIVEEDPNEPVGPDVSPDLDAIRDALEDSDELNLRITPPQSVKKADS
jgi:hypothetical protein